MNYFVVIPAYNEAPRIGGVIRGVKKFIKNIIVVDDGSKDRTSEVARGVGVRVLRHRINLGKGAAMKTGVELALELGADRIILLDADGQHDPKHIPEFIEQLDKGFDIVFGSRNLSFGVPLVRYLGNKFGSIFISLVFKIYRSDMLCGYMAFTKK
jgi:glycosyltransferase involved in cell wall biosynthesis